MTLPGAVKLDRALARLEQDATDANTMKAAAELVSFTAKQHTGSRRVQRTGRVSSRRGQGVVRFGSPDVPWAVPEEFGHGSPNNPRPQGGYMPKNSYLYRAADDREDDVVDLVLQRTADVIRDVGLG